MDYNFLSAVSGGVIGGLLAVVASVFSEELKRRIFGPSARLSFDQGSDCIVNTPMKGEDGSASTANYVRVRATNTKPIMAKNCRALLTNVEYKNAQDKFEKTIYCDSLVLAWAVSTSGQEHSPIQLAYGQHQFIDILFTHSGCGSIHWSWNILPMRYNTLFSRHGTYRLTVLLCGENIHPVEIALLIRWNGNWDQLEAVAEN